MSGSVIGAMIFGVLLVIVGFVHPIGPALMFAAETPFDVIPYTLFGVAGNVITYVPILIFLIRSSPALWGQIFLGTRVQQYLALFIVVLLVSHAQTLVDKGIGEIFEWLRKVTLFTVLSVFAYMMSQTKHLSLIAKTLAASMAIYTLLSMMDFHLGIQVLPIKTGKLARAALDTEFQSHLATPWRFAGAGYPVNRYSNYLLLPIFLGIGWFMSNRSPIQRTLALGTVAVLVLGEFLTVTRSGILGLAIGLIILMPMAFHFRPQQVLGGLIISFILGSLAWYGLSLTSADEVLAMRFGSGQVADATGGRIERILAALKIWAKSPLLGVGWGAFMDYSHAYIGTSGRGAHNGYLRVLAEGGLLAFLPMMAVTVAVLRRGLIRVGHISSELEFWRPYFFCALIAQLVTNIFNDYFWERYLWVTFAFMVALEHCYQAARASQPRTPLGEEPAAAPEPPAASPFRA